MASTHFGKLLSVGLLIGLAACARPVGDFGRAQSSVLHDEIMPAKKPGEGGGRPGRGDQVTSKRSFGEAPAAKVGGLGSLLMKAGVKK